MGIFRKMTSVSTAGLVDFRSDKERIARNTRLDANATRRLVAIEQRRDAAVGVAPISGSMDSAFAGRDGHGSGGMLSYSSMGSNQAKASTSGAYADFIAQAKANEQAARRQIGAAEPQANEAPKVAVAPSLVDQLAQLASLRNSGALSSDEFAAAKVQLLGTQSAKQDLP